jgi:hypothetical protein
MNLDNAFGRLLTAGDPPTELIALVADADNVIPHDLGRPITEALVTIVGDDPIGFGWSLKDPATLEPPQSADRVACFRVTADVTARVRVRAGL